MSVQRAIEEGFAALVSACVRGEARPHWSLSAPTPEAVQAMRSQAKDWAGHVPASAKPDQVRRVFDAIASTSPYWPSLADFLKQLDAQSRADARRDRQPEPEPEPEPKPQIPPITPEERRASLSRLSPGARAWFLGVMQASGALSEEDVAAHRSLTASEIDRDRSAVLEELAQARARLKGGGPLGEA